MKTIRNLFFVAFAAMTVAGCQEELANPNDEMQGTGNVVTFTGSVENALTKTTMWYEDNEYQTGAEFPTMFMNADHITVNGTESGDLTKNDDNGTNISFTVAGVTPPYYAVTSKHVNSYENGVYTVQVNGTGNPQDYRLVRSGKATSFDSQADILAAYSKDERLCFRHMCTFYAITVDAESEVKDNIKSIYIRQGGEQPNLAGKWKLSFTGENNAPVLEPSSMDAVIAYDCGEEGVAHGKVMIVGVPSYNYKDGLIFTLKDVNGKFASYMVPASKTDHTADGGKIIPFKPSFKPASGTIMTADDWEEFASAVNSGNDWDVYRWVGDGTVKLGANITATNLTTITKDFPYVFDGGGFTITRESATRPLFLEVSGEIRNLTLAGELKLDNYGAPFVRTLDPGGKITDCTNKMNVTFELVDKAAYIAGFAAVLPTTDVEGEIVTTISGCTNNGAITGTVAYTDGEKYNVAIGGVVGDVRAGGDAPYSVVLDGCKNLKEIRFTPVPPADHETPGMAFTGIGGVAGWIRSCKSAALNGCDNSGNITLSAEEMKTSNGMKAYSICMGGIIGCGTDCSGLGLTLNGYDISLTDCDNSGVLYNCGDNYSKTSENNNKVYTGGVAGSLVGLSEDHALLSNCSNTGNVITYDLCSDDSPVPDVVSTRPAYNAVAGGLIGFGAYLDMDAVTVSCQIGNGKRPMVSWGGVIGYAVGPFNLNGGTLNLGGYFQRISNYKFNRAVVAVVPDATTGLTPDVEGSSIKGSLTVSGILYSSGDLLSGASVTTNLVNTLTAKLFTTEAKVSSNLIGGGKSAQTTASGAGVEVSATITYTAAQ